eukprot:gene5734-4104_t
MPGVVEAASDVRPNTSPSSSAAGYFQTGSVSLLSSSVSSEGLMEPLIGQSPFVAASSSQRGYEHPVAHQPMAPAFRADSLEPVAVRPGQHIAGVSSLQTARQQATAKRLRENGRFKKAQTTWVSVTDLFFGS